VSFAIRSLRARPLRVPLLDPFRIATATLTTTLAEEIELVLEKDGVTHTGLGEAATLPPVTRETPEDVQRLAPVLEAALSSLRTAWSVDAIAPLLDAHLKEHPVLRAGIETAWLDAFAKHERKSLAHLLAGSTPWSERAFETDVTIPIASPSRMGELAGEWTAKGFKSLKVKVGRAHEDDLEGLRAIIANAPQARLRLDANAVMRARDALHFIDDVLAIGGVIELFEQPCRAEDLEGMAEVTKQSGGIPVIADESCKTVADVDALASRGAATGVNLKLVKHGGVLASLAVARRAREHGVQLMAGAMVETRLGLSAMLHLVTVMGVDYLDLDTALLLTEDPYIGGYSEALPSLRIDSSHAGLGILRR
jgi:L-alanine-DL-glutamate epimerase-like enolase superfamily enzyme